MYKRFEFIESFLSATLDSSLTVRSAAMNSLSRVWERLGDDQVETLVERARGLYDHDNRDIMLEARMLVTRRINRWLIEAGKLELQGQLAAAESLHHEARSFMPTSRKAGFSLGRFYYRTDRPDKAFDMLRESGSLLDVRHTDVEPLIDGRLDEMSWSDAPVTNPFETFSGMSDISIPGELKTAVRLLYTEEAIFFGIYCEEEFPDSLVVTDESYEQGAHQDLVEFFIKSDMDQEPICQIKVNSAGMVVDGILPRSRRGNFDITWNATIESAAHVGSDFWSAELKLPFEQPYFSRPAPGDL